MAGNDESTYGFRKDDADALISMIGMGETETPGARPGGGSGGVAIYGFELSADKLRTTKSVAANIYELDGENFGADLGAETLYDPAMWYGPALNATRGLCIKKGGKYYACQSSCGPEEYL